jgi:hypothetical protein
MEDQREGGEELSEQPTIVVNIAAGEECDVYIGRAMPRYGLIGNPWGNPFRVKTYGREGAIAAYRRWVLTSDHPDAKWIREHVHELKGKRLGCFCKPAACHGDVLAELADRMEERS